MSQNINSFLFDLCKKRTNFCLVYFNLFAFVSRIITFNSSSKSQEAVAVIGN